VQAREIIGEALTFAPRCSVRKNASVTHIKTARAATGKDFHERIRRPEALARVNGMNSCEALFCKLNVVLERHSNLIARRKSEPRAASNSKI
jgi:hypothetical protein